MGWTRVASVDDVAVGGAARVDVGGLPVCLVRTGDDAVKAIYDICSHEEEELHEGWVDDNTIECPAHGSTFNLDTGDPEVLPAVKPVPTYPVSVDEGAIYVDVERQLNDAPLPRH